MFVLLMTAAPWAVFGQSVPALDPSRALTQYHLDTWTSDDGLPQMSVNAVLQTSDSYLWVGTQEGLARFDGRHFRVYDKRLSALRKNDISALLEDRRGTLWIGTRGGGLTRWQAGEMTTFTTKDGLPSDYISALAEDAAGRLWIGTFDSGLAYLAGGRIVPLDVSTNDRISQVSALAVDTEGNLWIGTRNSGLARLGENGLTFFDVASGLPSNELTELTASPDGAVWAGTSGGLTRIHHGRLSTYTQAQGLPEGPILALHEDPAGVLWIGTERAGLVRFHNERFSILTEADGLAGNKVVSIGSDREGSLWVGLENGGLNRLKNGKFVPYSTQEGLAHNTAYAIYEDDAGGLWVGTDAGASRLFEGAFTSFTSAQGLGGNGVFSIWGSRDGSIWLGTNQGGLSRYKDGRFTSFTTADGLPDNSIFALYEDVGGTLWIGTNRGLGRYRNGTFTTLTTGDGLPSNFITAISEDREGRLAVGTYDGGLVLLKDGRVEAHYAEKDGLTSGFVLSLYPDEDGALWFGLYEGGLGRLKNGTIQVLTSADGLFNDNVFQILEDGAGNLWMSCNQGVFFVNKQEVEEFFEGNVASVRSTVFDKSDGLRSKEFNGGVQPAGWRSRDGRLWFPSNMGIASIDPRNVYRNTVPPPVVIESLIVDEQPVVLDGDLELSPGASRLEFQFVGLSLLAPDQVRYRYRLEGVDDHWLDAGVNRQASYTNLSPGRYTFRVQAMNGDGVWSATPAAVSFYLKPFFYQTPWFYLLCLLAAGASVAGAYRLRVRQLEMRQRELEGLIQERTRKLRQEKEKTEQAKAIIEEQADRLREMDRMKTRFFNNISHEFRTPLTLNIGPLENALTGVYGPVGNTLRTQLEIMLRNSRRLLRLINQLLDLSKLEAGKMRVRMRGGNLVELLEGVVMSFSAFAELDNLDLAFSADPERLDVVFDPESMEKVFFNLLSNAVKFTPSGGKIRVTITECASCGSDRKGTVEIRVADTGPGIPEHQLPYIFDRFHQVDGTVSKVQEGTGIGLALARELVELHGGHIEVNSTVGVGTEFIVVLPREVGHHPVSSEEPYIPGSDELVSRGPMVELAVLDEVEPVGGDGAGLIQQDDTRPLVLAVDDNADIRSYVASCLASDYRVITAADGQAAFDIACEQHPDLIVCDVMMPNIDGYAFCKTIKSDPNLDHIPIILLTSRASLEDKIEGFEAGADDYVTKPFNARELLARVRSLLSLRVQQSELKHLNHELKQANEALHDVTEHKSQMLRIVAHDLKNPLNAVRELAKVIRQESHADGSAHDLLDLIQDASDQMLHMVTQLLESEALESGRFELHKEGIDLALLAADVVRHNEPQALRKNQQIALMLGDGPFEVLADRELLKEAIDNLVNNAIKYSPTGEAITVRVHSTDGSVRLEVTDRGPGLSEEDKQHLFKKFQRLSATPTGGESSTGLGLSIVKQILELHDGHVWAESTLGSGSTFSLALALQAETDPVPA